jgi:hypothetical protein
LTFLGTNLVLVLNEVAQDAALVPAILNPVDEFGAGAGQLTILRERGHAREDQDGGASRMALLTAAEVLRTRVHVDGYGLRLSGQGDGLVGADDDLRQRGRWSFRVGLRQRLDQPGMTAAKVGEDIRDAGFR